MDILRMDNHRTLSWLQWIALTLMALYAAFWALFGAGEIMAGEWSGIIYFVPVILILGLMFLSWKRPTIGGIVAILAGILLSMRSYSSLERPSDQISAALVIGGPFILAGILCIAHSFGNRPRQTEENTHPTI